MYYICKWPWFNQRRDLFWCSCFVNNRSDVPKKQQSIHFIMRNFHACLFSCMNTAIHHGRSQPSRRPRLPPGHLSLRFHTSVLWCWCQCDSASHLLLRIDETTCICPFCTIQRNGYHVNDYVRRKMWNDNIFTRGYGEWKFYTRGYWKTYCLTACSKSVIALSLSLKYHNVLHMYLKLVPYLFTYLKSCHPSKFINNLTQGTI